ncbi:MAG TPA: hypothetical protein VF450_02945 [Noviherbaspirillum sp.]
MTTTSRGLSRKARTSTPSRTPGKDKGGSCVKTELKTWGANANPYKLRGSARQRYEVYRETTNAMNK